MRGCRGRDRASAEKNQETGQPVYTRAGATWEMTIYSGTRHGFTNPDAGAYGMENLQYNARADKESWAAMLRMFEETLKGM